MVNKRFNKFNREFSSVPKTDIFNKIRDLYVEGIIKTIPSANKLLKKIKYTKKKELYKTSLKTAETVTEQYNKFIVPKQVIKPKQEKINQSILKLNKKLIFDRGLEVWIHYNEFNKLIRSNPDAHYVQTVKFHYNDGSISEDFPYHTIKMFSKSKGKLSKAEQGEIAFKMTSKESYDWLIKQWVVNEDGGKNAYATIKTVAYKKINIVNQGQINQSYKENESNTCVYDGFLKFFSDPNKKTKMRTAMYNKLLKYKNKYAKAYTDETLQEICQFTNTSLTIKDLIHNNDKVIKIDNATWSIQFVNTKINHLDYLVHSYNELIELNNKKEYYALKEKFDQDKNKFYIEQNGTLITLDKTYKVKEDDFTIVFNEWKNQINYYDLIVKEDTFKLIQYYDYSMHCFFNDFEVNNKLYDELDISKAYYNYSNIKLNPNYHGVPAGSFIYFNCKDTFTIDDFNEQLENGIIGYYQVKILKINKKINHFNKLGIYDNIIDVYTSVQIDAMKDYITFKFLEYEVSPNVHIPFTEAFLKKTVHDTTKGEVSGVKYYCKAFGLMMRSSDYIKMTIKPLLCDKQYLNIIHNENTNIYEREGIIKIEDKNYNRTSCKHISYYIHSYIKTLVLQQILTLNIDDIFGVKLDSIVIKKGAIIKQLLPCFPQELKVCKIEGMLKNTQYNTDEDEEQNNNGSWFRCDLDGHLVWRDDIKPTTNAYYRPLFKSSIKEQIKMAPNSFLPNEEPIKNRLIFMSGKGGCGKSYAVLNNNKSVCMASQNWNLVQKKKQDFDIYPLSINRVVGDGCDKARITNKILFLDELTMWKKEHIETALELYKHKFVFLAGDIDFDGRFYQCNNQNEVINPSELNCQFVKYFKNFRFDDNLNNLLDGLRECDSVEEQLKYINIHFKDCFKNKKDVIYDDKTVGISDINETSALTNYFLSKGTKERYYIKNTYIDKKEYKGAEVFDITKTNNYEMKLFKTIHSFQGLDLERDQKIIISNTKNFDRNLWYTAFSRARRLDQIIILKN